MKKLLLYCCLLSSLLSCSRSYNTIETKGHKELSSDMKADLAKNKRIKLKTGFQKEERFILEELEGKQITSLEVDLAKEVTIDSSFIEALPLMDGCDFSFKYPFRGKNKDTTLISSELLGLLFQKINPNDISFNFRKDQLNIFDELPKHVTQYKKLESILIDDLDVEGYSIKGQLRELMDALSKKNDLRSCEINIGSLKEYPLELNKIINLRFLEISRTKIREIPESIGALKKMVL